MNSNIKKIILLTFIVISSTTLLAKKKSKIKIQWMTIAEVEQKLKTEPRKIIIDLYTSWCYWCKVMDKKTYKQEAVADYMNNHFYCIKLNAEQKESIKLKDIEYQTPNDTKTNNLAADWMQGQISYPSTIFMNAQFEAPKPVAGYIDAETMLALLHYVDEELETKIPFEVYKTEFNKK
jgi:thioredoxin-related protein